MTHPAKPIWSREGSHPPEGLIQSCCDGLRPSEDTSSVQAHCKVCASCRSLWDEYVALGEVLDSHDAPLMPSIWPSVRAEISPKISTFARWAYSVGGAAAVAAGLLFGFLIVPTQDESSEGWRQATWTEMGSLLTDDASFGSLDEAYWSMMLPDEDPASPDGEQLP